MCIFYALRSALRILQYICSRLRRERQNARLYAPLGNSGGAPYDAGKALSREEEARLLYAIGRSPSPSLLPFFVHSLDGGLRPSETRGLRHRDLRLSWRDGVIAEGEVIVGQSKTEAGSGRAVPLTRRAAVALTLWLARFPQAKPDSYVFPFHHIGISTEKNS
jgi:integrase